MDDAKQTRKVDAIDCLGAGMTTFYIILWNTILWWWDDGPEQIHKVDAIDY